jgi:hypothetical protein
MALSNSGGQTPCWVGKQARLPGRYLAGCTVDGCTEHGSLYVAAAVCDLLASDCGGVTAMLGVGSFQTRSGGAAKRGPTNESSWLKQPCSPPPSAPRERFRVNVANGAVVEDADDDDGD